MWLGNTMDVPTYDLGSSVIGLVHSMKSLGVTIDKDLNFTEHVADIVCRVSNQIQVLQRHKKFINTDTKIKIIQCLPIATFILLLCRVAPLWSA